MLSHSNLQLIAQRLNAKIILPANLENLFIKGVKLDSRQVETGNLFIALQGENANGHAYVKNLPANTFALVEQEQNATLATQILVADVKQAFWQLAKFARENFTKSIIGITGNSGKTSVKDILNSLLNQAFKADATKGNFNNDLGLPMSLLNFQSNIDLGILEMGANHKSEIRQLASIAQPNIAIITNVTGAHLGEFGSMDNIAQAKAEILENLTNKDLAILPYGDKYYNYWSDFNNNCNQISFGKSANADISFCDLTTTPKGSKFKVKVNSAFLDKTEISPELFLPALGEHQVLNALACIAVALYLKMDWEQIKTGLANFATSKGRMQVLDGINESCIIDDTYNANAGSVKAGIDYLASQTDKTKILVLGDIKELGDYGEQIHRELGQYAQAKKIDFLFTYGQLAEFASVEFGVNAKAFFDKDLLVQELKSLLDKNSLVLCKASHSMHLDEILPKLRI